MRRLLRRQVPNMNAVPSQRPALRHPGLLDALREAPEPYFVETHRLRRTSVSAPPLHLCGRTQRPCLACPLIEKNDIPRFRRVSFDRRRETLIHPGIRAEGDSSTSGRSWQERGAATATIRFEELMADPVASVSDAGAELNLDLLEGTGDLHSFEDRRALLPANFRLGKVGSWRDEMPDYLEERFWWFHGSAMEPLDYPRSLPTGRRYQSWPLS
jgi:hypothetical protein